MSDWGGGFGDEGGWYGPDTSKAGDYGTGGNDGTASVAFGWLKEKEKQTTPQIQEYYNVITGNTYFSDPKYYLNDIEYWRKSEDWDASLSDEQNIANLRQKYYSLPLGMAVYGDPGFTQYKGIKNPNFDQARILANQYGTNYPSFTEWAQDTGYQSDVFQSPEYQAMQQLLAYFTGEDVTGRQAATEEAKNYAGSLMGFGEGTYESNMQNLLGQLESGVAGQPGYTEEYQRNYNRQTMAEIRSLNEEMNQTIEALGAEGRFGKAFTAMNESRAKISNYAIQRDMAFADAEFARQQVEYQALASRYELLVSKGGEYTGEYLNMLEQKKALGLQSYATNIQTILTQNAAYLDQYRADLASIEANVKNAYNLMMATDQLESNAIEQANQWWETYMAPYLQQLEEELSKEALKVAGKTASADVLSGIFGALGNILGSLFG